jgi:hypothetical protein
MNDRFLSYRHAALACVACGILLGCKDIPRAKSGLPRVEVEVAVTLDDSFAEKLEGVDDQFRKAVTDAVLSEANVGLRFYPVLTDQYSEGQARPPYLMSVQLRGLGLEVDEARQTKKDGETARLRWISRVSCSAETTLEKRREDGPPLMVDRATSTSARRLSQPELGTTIADGLTLKEDALRDEHAGEGGGEPDAGEHDGEGEHAGEAGGEHKLLTSEPLQVARQNVVVTARSAVRESLSEMVTAIDRELSLQAPKPSAESESSRQ